MALDDQNALDDEQDPTADTPAPDAEQAAEADDQPGSGQDDRLKEAQATITRQAQELALFRAQAGADDEADEESISDDGYRTRLEDESWTLAEQVYGEEAIDAYRAAFGLMERAVTPADFMAAFEAYHDIRSGRGEAPAASASGTPSRAAALTPKVDTNRSDLGPDLQDAEAQLAEARKGNSLEGFAAAAARRMGFGGVKS